MWQGAKMSKLFFFQQIKSAAMPVQHVKGQPAASTYVREKGGVKKYSNRDTPCSNSNKRGKQLKYKYEV